MYIYIQNLYLGITCEYVSKNCIFYICHVQCFENLFVYIYIFMYASIPGTQMTLVLIGKNLVAWRAQGKT